MKIRQLLGGIAVFSLVGAFLSGCGLMKGNAPGDIQQAVKTVEVPKQEAW